MDEAVARALIGEHFAYAGKDEVRASALYTDDAVLEFPQGRERIRGRENICAFRTAYPAQLDFEVHRTAGCGDLWVNQYTIRYDGVPHLVVGIMEFRDAHVYRETVYVTEPWDPPAWRARWVEPLTSDER